MLGSKLTKLLYNIIKIWRIRRTEDVPELGVDSCRRWTSRQRRFRLHSSTRRPPGSRDRRHIHRSEQYKALEKNRFLIKISLM